MEVLVWVFSGFEPGRLIESIIVALVLLARVTPHLRKMEKRMGGVETAVNSIDETVRKGFAEGEKKFKENDDKIAASGLRLDGHDKRLSFIEKLLKIGNNENSQQPTKE